MEILKVLEGLLKGIIMSPFLIITLVIFLVNLIIRSIVSISLSLQYGSRIVVMNSSDAALCVDKIGSTATHTTLNILEGNYSIEKLKERCNWFLTKKLKNSDTLIYSKLKCKCVTKFGYLCWEDMGSKFDLSQHVKLISEDPTATFTEQEIVREIEKFIDIPLSVNKPAWEILVVPNIVKNSKPIDGEENKSYHGIVLRMQHGIMDGISTSIFFSKYLCDSQTDEEFIAPISKNAGKSIYRNIFEVMKLCAILPSYIFDHYNRRENNYLHGPELTGPKTLKRGRKIKLEAVKLIKNSTRSSITSVLISCFGRAIKNVSEKGNISIPSKINCAVPFEVFPPKGDVPRNQFAFVILPIHIGQLSSVERLKETHATCSKDNISSKLLGYYLINMLGTFPRAVIYFSYSYNIPATFTVSNIVSSSKRLSICGRQVVDILSWTPLTAKLGIGLTSVSNSGLLQPCVSVDATVYKKEVDAVDLVDEFENELLKLAKFCKLLPNDVYSYSDDWFK